MDKLKQNFILLPMMVDKLTMAPIHRLQSKSTGKMYEFRAIRIEEGRDLLKFASEIVRSERDEKINKILNDY